MQKKLLAIAIAAAVTAPVAARADVTVYGQMHYSYDYVMAQEDEGATGVARYSRIGFKGAEDLGGGLKGVWQIEGQINNDSNTMGWRNTFVGLAGDWGTVLAGRHDTPYKISTQKLDFFTDRAADYNNIIGSYNGYLVGDTRAPQTIAYVLPNLSGFTGALAYVDHYFDSTPGSDCSLRLLGGSPANCYSDESDTALSAMLMYDNAGFFATVAYEWAQGYNLLNAVNSGVFVDTNAAANAAAVALGGRSASVVFENPELNMWKVGLGYTFGGTTIGGIWENIDLDGGKIHVTTVPATGAATTTTVDTKSEDRNAYYLTAQHVFGNNVIKGYYGWADDIQDTDNTGTDAWAVGYDYNFSKRTTLYALYTMVQNDDSANYTANKAQGVGSGYTNPGDDVDVVSVGVIHKF